MLVALAAMPEVVRYIGDGHPWSAERADELSAAAIAHWETHGFGWRAVYEREPAGANPDDRPRAEPIGLIALNLTGEGSGVGRDEYEIGWWMSPALWGRGLAREGALAVRDDAFINVGAPNILALIQPSNSASLAVAEAIGLSFERGGRGRHGEEISVLRLTADTWRARREPGEG